MYATDIRFDEQTVIRYRAPNQVLKRIAVTASCYLVRPFEVDNMKALFEQERRQGETSPMMVFYIGYSDIDRKHEWRLCCEFGYRYSEQQFFLIHQFTTGPF